MKKYLLIAILSFLILNSCNLGFSGTLGGSNIYKYACNKDKLNFYLDSIEKSNLSLKIPENWKKYDDWDETGYGFLKGKIFYIKGNNSNDDEMYFVSVIPPRENNENSSGVSIRSVFRGKEYLLGWKNFKDLKKSEKTEIEAKFQNKVLSQLPLKFYSVDEE